MRAFKKSKIMEDEQSPDRISGEKARAFSVQLLVFLGDTVRDVFVASFLSYLLLLILEHVKRGFASHFINLDVIMWLVIVSGLLAGLTGGFTRKAFLSDNGIPGALTRMAGSVLTGITAAVAILVSTSVTGWKGAALLVISGFLGAIVAWLLTSPSRELVKKSEGNGG